MSPYSEIINVILLLLKAAVSLYYPLMELMWQGIYKYGIMENSAFLGFVFDNRSFLILYSTIYRYTIPVLITALIGLVSLLIIIFSSKNSAVSINSVYLRTAATVIISSSTFYIFSSLLSFLGTVYALIYSYSNIDFENFSSVSGISILPVAGTSISADLLLRFLLLSAYFAALASLFAVLMFRQAIMIFMILLMPFFTALYIFNPTGKYTKMAWELTMEMTMFPFAVILSLTLASFFRSDVPLNLAFLFLPTVLPGFMLFSGRGLSSTPMMGLIGGMTLGSITSRGSGIAMSSMDAAATGNPLPVLAASVLMPAADYKTIKRNTIPTTKEVSWLDEALKDDMKYRKKYDG